MDGEDMHEDEAGSMQFSNRLGKAVKRKDSVVKPLQQVRFKDKNNTQQLGIISAVAAKVGDIGPMIAHRLSRIVFVVAVVEDLQEEEQCEEGEEDEIYSVEEVEERQ